EHPALVGLPHPKNEGADSVLLRCADLDDAICGSGLNWLPLGGTPFGPRGAPYPSSTLGVAIDDLVEAVRKHYRVDSLNAHVDTAFQTWHRECGIEPLAVNAACGHDAKAPR